MNWPAAMKYRAWKRSRVRGWDAPTEVRRKSSGVWPHLAVSTRTIGFLPAHEGKQPRLCYPPAVERKLLFSNESRFKPASVMAATRMCKETMCR